MVLKQKIVLLIFILIGTLLQTIPTIRSGLQYSYGYGFWGPSGHDGVWHLSLINHISNPLSIPIPTLANHSLTNYHPFFNVLISGLSRSTNIDSSLWLFQLFPILSSIIILYLSFILGQKYTKTFLGGIILLSLTVTANSFGWLISYLKNGTFGGESIFWAMQSPSNQINPPYALSLILILGLLVILQRHLNSQTLTVSSIISIFIILILLPITKAYSAITGFGIFGIYSLVSLKKGRNVAIIIFTLSLICSFLVFKVYNSSPSNIFRFSPLWFSNSLIDSPDKLYFPRLSSFRNTLESLNYFDPRLIPVYLFCLVIFIIGNFAWRLLGFLVIFQKPNYFTIAIFSLVIINLIIPTLFIQQGTSWNTIQFLYYSQFLANILLTKYLVQTNHNLFRSILITIVFVSNTIGLIGMLPNYLGKIPPTSIPIEEMSALTYLRQQPPGTVLTAPYDAHLKDRFTSTPIPLYAYETTSYVAAYSHHPTFVDDYMNLINSQFSYQPRLDSAIKFFKQQNIHQDRGFLLNNNISYIYLTGYQISSYQLDINNLYLQKIYQNGQAAIYKVLK